MDLTDGIFWGRIAAEPLGKFIAFDVQDFSHELPNRTVSGDELLSSGEFEKAKEARKCPVGGTTAFCKEVTLERPLNSPARPRCYKSRILPEFGPARTGLAVFGSASRGRKAF